MKKREYQPEFLIYSNTEAQVSVFAATINEGRTPVVVKMTVFARLEEANATINEAMTQGKLEHENICKIIDCFLEETENRQFASILILERMKCDLANEISRRKTAEEYWTEYELLYDLYSLAKALNYAQSKDVSHRDIKPQNIFITENGELKLGDFGSATRQKALTQLMGVQGTPLYLSPELRLFYQQSFSNPAAMPDIDSFKSDVYSLGVTTLFMATLEAPVLLLYSDRPQTATAEAIQAVSGYPTLAWFLQRMLEADPRNRASFQELENQLETCCGQPSYSQPVLQPTQSDCYQMPNPPDYAAGVPAQQYEKASNGYDYRQPLNTVTNSQTYSCSICGSYFLDPMGWQVIGDGNYCCSEGCKKKYDSYFCQKCNRQITDNSWWSKARQTYPEHIDQFPLYCSLFCFSSSLPQQQEIKCMWCQISIVAAFAREMKIIQLDCLHIFHDIGCLIKYMASISANFTEKVDFACPICRANIPAEIVEMAFRILNERKGEETLKCQKCNSQKGCYTFKCKHILCGSCCLWKKKYFGFGKTKLKCSMCDKRAWYE